MVLDMIFDINKAEAFELYKMTNGNVFEFRYVSQPDYGFIFAVMMLGGDAYLTSKGYEGAELIESASYA